MGEITLVSLSELYCMQLLVPRLKVDAHACSGPTG